jgi:hypothetical protein
LEVKQNSGSTKGILLPLIRLNRSLGQFSQSVDCKKEIRPKWSDIAGKTPPDLINPLI